MNGAIDIQEGSLAYEGQSSTGNRLRFTLQEEDGSKWCNRELAQPFENGQEVWLSCLIQPIAAADGGFWVQPNGRQDIAIGKRWGRELAIDNNGSGINVQENTVSKLVVRYTLESNQTVAHLWVNRNEGFTEANANATKTVGAIANINSIQISMEKWGNGVFEIDELHIGCSPEKQGENPPGPPAPPSMCEELLPQQANYNLGGKRILVIRGVDPATHTWTDTDADLQKFNTELDAYVRRNSFNRTWVETFDLTPVYNFTVPPEGMGFYAMGNTLRELALSNGYAVDSYDIIAYIHESTTDFGGAGALGSGNGSGGSLWANNSLSWYYNGNIHETFHSLGVGHAEGIEGDSVMFPGRITGGHDPYHFMGSEGDGSLNSDIPNYMKYFLGWIDPQNISCLPEIPSTGGCITQRIYKTTGVSSYDASRQYAVQLGENLWLSYEPDNQNSQIVKKGVLLHHIPGPGSAVTRLLDPTPNSITVLPPGISSAYEPVKDLWDAAIEQGEVVIWEGAAIKVVSTGGTGNDKWVDIEFCNCISVSGDSDNDGVCDDLDLCAGQDDKLDADSDGIPDACDSCPLDAANDLNQDGICDNEQCVPEAKEDFAYEVGELTGANGGQGFSSAWEMSSSNVPSVSATIEPGSLTPESPLGNTFKIELLDDTEGFGMNRSLSFPFVNGQVLWLSVAVKAHKIGDGGFWIQPGGNQAIAIGKRWGTNFSIDNNSSPIPMAIDQVYWLVAKYDLQQEKTLVHLWVNPTAEELQSESTPDAY